MERNFFLCWWSYDLIVIEQVIVKLELKILHIYLVVRIQLILISTSDKYNGTSWSTDVNIPVALKSGTGTGTKCCHSFGGRSTSPSTFEYNGTAWTTTVDLNPTMVMHYLIRLWITKASALAVGGYGKVTCSETYTTTGIGCHCIGGV